MATRRDAAIWVSVPASSAATLVGALWLGVVPAERAPSETISAAQFHALELKVERNEIRSEGMQHQLDRIERRLNRYTREQGTSDSAVTGVRGASSSTSPHPEGRPEGG